MEGLPEKVVSLLDQEIVNITLTTLVRLFELDTDAVLLYVFYCYTAKLQSRQIGYTNKIKASRSYCLKGLHWGPAKYHRTKNILEDNGFIEAVQKKRKSGEFDDSYVQINYLLNSYKAPESSYKPVVSNDTSDRLYRSPLVAFDTTNADNKNRNADKEKYIYIPDRPIVPSPKQGNRKKANEHILSSIPVTSHSVQPLDEQRIYEIAKRKNVPLHEVQRVHESVLVSIEDGNKYKLKDISRAVYKWLELGISRGGIQHMSTEERMIFEMSSPEEKKKLQALVEQMKEQDMI